MENRIKITPFDDGLLIKITGELDSLHVMSYKDMIVGEMNRKNPLYILWDFKDLTFLDSAGIGLILGRYNDIRRIHGECGFIGLNAYSRKIINITGLFSIIDEYKSISTFKKKRRINV